MEYLERLVAFLLPLYINSHLLKGSWEFGLEPITLRLDHRCYTYSSHLNTSWRKVQKWQVSECSYFEWRTCTILLKCYYWSSIYYYLPNNSHFTAWRLPVSSKFLILFYFTCRESRADAAGRALCRNLWRVGVPLACLLDTFTLTPQSLTNPSWWSHKNQSQKALPAGAPCWGKAGFSAIFTHENRELHCLEPAAASKTDFSAISCFQSSWSPSQAASWKSTFSFPCFLQNFMCHNSSLQYHPTRLSKTLINQCKPIGCEHSSIWELSSPCQWQTTSQ